MTEKEELQTWRKVGGRLGLYMDFSPHKIKDLLTLIGNWDYAHRAGNGELSDEEQQEKVDRAMNLIKVYLEKE